MPDGWEWLHGLDLLADDATLDPDTDRADNLAEYIAGTDPHDVQSVFQCLEVHPVNFPMIGKILTWPGSAGRLYSAHASTNLLTGFHMLLATNLPATPPLNRYTATVEQTHAVFYSIGARLP